MLDSRNHMATVGVKGLITVIMKLD